MVLSVNSLSFFTNHTRDLSSTQILRFYLRGLLIRFEFDDVADIAFHHHADSFQNSRADVFPACHASDSKGRDSGRVPQIGLVHVLVDEQFPKLFV